MTQLPKDNNQDMHMYSQFVYAISNTLYLTKRKFKCSASRFSRHQPKDWAPVSGV